MTRLEHMLAGTPYAGYAYAYPHKSAYRSLDPPVPLREAWRAIGVEAPKSRVKSSLRRRSPGIFRMPA